MNIYSLLSFIVFVLYFGLGIYVLGHNPKSKINRNFFYYTLSIAIWSYAYIFLFAATDKESVFYWDRIGSIGWCNFPALILSFHLVLTKSFNKIKYYLITLYHLAGVAFTIKSFTGVLLTKDWIFNGSDWIPLVENTSSPWYWLYNFYLASAVILCVVLILIWRKKEQFKRVKIQAFILFSTLSITIIGGYCTNFIIPILKISEIPNLAHIISLVWVLGIAYSIMNYQLMTLTPKVAANEIIKEMKELLFFIDNNGTIIGTNKYTEDKTGFSNNNLKQLHISEIFIESETINALLKNDILEKGSKNIELHLRTETVQKIPVKITVSVIKDKAGEKIGSVIIGRDISQKKLLEKEIEERKTAQLSLKIAHDDLEEKIKQRTLDLLMTNSALQNEVFEHKKAKEELFLAKQKAEESDRLKSAFLANMSHEIRTPLNGILGFTDILKDQSLNNEERIEYLSIIESCGDHLLELINDIIDISKIEAGQIVINKTTFDLHKFLTNLFATFDPNVKQLSGKDITLNLITNQQINPEIYTDELRLRQVFVNLISNALKFTEKGNIDFGYSYDDKSNLTFFVKDTGVGIPQEKVSQIFDRFVQVDNSTTKKHRGTGLGLTITKELLELLGGTISVESTEENLILGQHGGSTFTFSIPVSQ